MNPAPEGADGPTRVRIESHLAHLEHLYDQLNRVVVEQGRELHRLQLELRRVARSLEGIERQRIDQTNAKPPHYQ